MRPSHAMEQKRRTTDKGEPEIHYAALWKSQTEEAT